jgi:hypothetical protein
MHAHTEEDPMDAISAETISAEARPSLRGTGAAALDVAQMTEQIWRELGGKASRETVQQVVSDAVSGYQDARILSYVPIFVRQDALRALTSRR